MRPDGIVIIDPVKRSEPVLLHSEYGAESRVHYVGLPKTFIAGVLVGSKGESLAGAEVTATDQASGTVQARATSDFIGDFWLGLEAKKNFDVTIAPFGKTKRIVVSLNADMDLGDIED